MTNHSTTPLYMLFGRVLWMVAGPAVLLLLSCLIVLASTGWLTTIDLLFFVVLAAMIFGRWLEFVSGQATTAYGTRATRDDFKYYAVTVVLVGLGIWGVVNVLGNHVL